MPSHGPKGDPHNLKGAPSARPTAKPLSQAEIKKLSGAAKSKPTAKAPRSLERKVGSFALRGLERAAKTLGGKIEEKGHDALKWYKDEPLTDIWKQMGKRDQRPVNKLAKVIESGIDKATARGSKASVSMGAAKDPLKAITKSPKAGPLRPVDVGGASPWDKPGGAPVLKGRAGRGNRAPTPKDLPLPMGRRPKAGPLRGRQNLPPGGAPAPTGRARTPKDLPRPKKRR